MLKSTTGVSDHKLLSWYANITATELKYRKLSKRVWKNFNIDKFREDICVISTCARATSANCPRRNSTAGWIILTVSSQVCWTNMHRWKILQSDRGFIIRGLMRNRGLLEERFGVWSDGSKAIRNANRTMREGQHFALPGNFRTRRQLPTGSQRSLQPGVIHAKFGELLIRCSARKEMTFLLYPRQSTTMTTSMTRFLSYG